MSVLWGIADPGITSELQAGHERAVAEALGYLERQACLARRGRGGCVQVKGGGFAAAAFLHRASRAGDPLLHTHAVVGNLTIGPDGRWTALDARHIYRHAKTAGYLYQAALRRELTERLGVAWQPVEHGVADIHGIPRGVVEHFSQRRAQILEHMAEHGAHSAKAAQVAALETRARKAEPPVDRLRGLWRSRAAEHGLDPDEVGRIVGRSHHVHPLQPVDEDVLTEHASTFGRAELIQALAEAQATGAHTAELEAAADAMLARTRIVQLQDAVAAGGAAEARYSTRRHLHTEAWLLAHAEARTATGAGQTHPLAVTRAIADRGAF